MASLVDMSEEDRVMGSWRTLCSHLARKVNHDLLSHSGTTIALKKRLPSPNSLALIVTHTRPASALTPRGAREQR